MKLKRCIFIFLITFSVFIINCYADGKKGDELNSYDTLNLCEYTGTSVGFGNEFHMLDGAVFTISPATTQDKYYWDLTFKFGKNHGTMGVGLASASTNYDVYKVEIDGEFTNGFQAITTDNAKDNSLLESTTVDYNESSTVGYGIYKKGTCPKYVAIKVSKKLSGMYYIKKIYFNATKPDGLIIGWYDAVDLPGNYIITGLLSSSLLSSDVGGTQPLYKDYTNNECFDKNKVSYYASLYSQALKKNKNNSFLNMYKENNLGPLGYKIMSTHAEGGQCYNQNVELQSDYKAMVSIISEASKLISGAKSVDIPVGEVSCAYILGDPNNDRSVAFYIDRTFRFIKFIGPILVIIFSMIDYIKAMVSSDADLIKKTNTKTLIRLLFAMLLFVLPVIISYLLTLLGAQGSCNFNNIPGI